MNETIERPEKIVAIGPNTTIKAAANKMLANNIGCLIVNDDNGAFAGIVTERDIVSRVAGSSVDLESTTIAEIMTSRVVLCPVGTPASKARHSTELTEPEEAEHGDDDRSRGTGIEDPVQEENTAGRADQQGAEHDPDRLGGESLRHEFGRFEQVVGLAQSGLRKRSEKRAGIQDPQAAQITTDIGCHVDESSLGTRSHRTGSGIGRTRGKGSLRASRMGSGPRAPAESAIPPPGRTPQASSSTPLAS